MVQGDSAGPPAAYRSNTRFALAGLVLSTLCLALGLVGLVGWVTGIHVLGSIRAEYVPMAPDTAVIFCLLGFMFLVHSVLPLRGAGRAVALVLVALVSLYGLLKFVEYFVKADLTFENVLLPATGQLGAFPLGRMSPVAGLLFFLSGTGAAMTFAGQWSEGRRRRALKHSASLSGWVAMAAGLITGTAYLFGAPLLYGGTIIPVAATTAFAFLIFGAMLVLEVGAEGVFIRAFLGQSVRARLLRAFLPLTVGVVLAEGLLHEALDNIPGLNFALLTEAFSLGIAVIAGVVIFSNARVIARGINEASERQFAAEASSRASEATARDQAARAKALYEVSRAISWQTDPGELATVSLDASLKALELDGGCIRFLDAGGDMVAVATRGLSAEADRLLRSGRVEAGVGLAGVAIKEGKNLAIEDLHSDPRLATPSIVERFSSGVYIVLRSQNQPLGVMSGWSLRKRSFTEDEIEALTGIGNMIGVAIANARLYERIRAGREEWQKTFDSMSDGVAILDMDRRIVRANKALASMYGKTPPAMVGRRCHEVIHGTSMPIPACLFDECIASRRARRALRCEDEWGNRWVQMDLDPLLGPGGEAIGAIHTFKDVSVEKRQEEDARRLHRLSQVLSSSLDTGTVVRAALEEISTAFCSNGDTIGVALADQFTRRLVVAEARGMHAAQLNGAWIKLDALPSPGKDNGSDGIWTCANDSDPGPFARFVGSSGIAAPMSSAAGAVGVLFLETASALDSGKKEMFKSCARQIAMAVENATAYAQTDEALRIQIKYMALLRDVLGIIANSVKDIDTVFKLVLQKTVEGLAVDGGGVYLLDRSGKVTSHVENVPAGSATDWLFDDSMLRGLYKSIAGREKPIVVAGGFNEGVSCGSALLATPIVLRGALVGMLVLTTALERTYAEDEASLVQAISGHLATVIENVRLYQSTEDERSRLQSIVSSMAEGLVVVDESRRLVHCNPAADLLLGIEARKYIACPVELFQSAWAQRVVDRDRLRADWSTAVGNLLIMPRVDFQLAGPGERRDIQATLFPISSIGRRPGMGALFRDVTREREVDRMKSEFVSIVSHELRTPMTSVYGFAELLLMKASELPEQHREWIETIHKESKRLTDIVEDLLNVSRIESGKVPINMEAVDLASLAADIAVQLKVSHPWHNLIADLDGVPKVLADSGKLHQVLYNLTDNAMKYSPNWKDVLLRASVVSGGREVAIAVEDRGLGIDPSATASLFSKFNRVQNKETVGIRGTGLGLYIVKSFVDLMGGRISVQSRPGAGSTFMVTLPAAVASRERL